MKRKLIIIALILVALAVAAPMIWRATENDRDITDTRIEGDRLFISGTLNAKTYSEIAQILDENPALKIVELEQIDGSIDDEINLQTALLIHNAKLDMYVGADADIQSGAVDLFCAGRRRIAHPDAQIGVHSWADNEGHSGDKIPKNHPHHQPYLDYFSIVGCPISFYWFTLQAASADDMHFMSVEELKRLDVVTRFEQDNN